MTNKHLAKIKNSKLLIPFLFLSLIVLVLLNLSQVKLLKQHENKNDVLGASYKSPQIYFSNYGEDYKSSAGGVISLSTTDSPTVGIGGYNVIGESEIEIYESNEDALIDYMTHDKENKQIKKSPDKDKIKYITTIKKDIKSGENNSERNEVLLPITGRGIWYLKIKLSGLTADAFVVRSDNGTLVKEGDNEFVFWGQNFKTKRNATEGIVIVYNLENQRQEIQRSNFDSEGIAKAKITKDADIALVAIGDDRSVIPLNLEYINYGYSYERYQEKVRKSRYFIFTDRPIYKPGDTINFKAIVRDDDDARYTLPTGGVNVKIFDGYYYESSNNLPIYDQNLPLSSGGSIAGSYKIPENSKTGYYDLTISTGAENDSFYYDEYYSSNSVSFLVEHYKKPEFFIDVKSNVQEAIVGDDMSFTVNGNYFSGQPLVDESIRFDVRSSDYYEYSYLSDAASFSQSFSDDYRYWYSYGDSIDEGNINLNKNGESIVKIDNKKIKNKGNAQIFSIDVSTNDKSRTPANSRKNILVYPGEFGIFRKDYSYGSKINDEYTLPIKLLAHKNNINLSGISLTAKIVRHDWNVIQDSKSKYPTYQEIKENLDSLKTKTEGDGEAQFKFTPIKTGQYTITVEGKDKRGNLINKEFYAYFSKEDYPYYSNTGNSDLTISSDKQKYQPNETAKISLYSYVPNRDVFLNFQRGRLDRYKVLHLDGKTVSVDLPLIVNDMPNTFVSVSSFDDNSLNTNSLKIPVSAESKKVTIKLTPDLKKYGPGDSVNLNVKTTDTNGNPVSTEVAVWAVDKAIFELAENNLGNIFKNFWDERYDNTVSSHSLEGIMVQGAEGGGCLLAGTKILMADGKTKNIEDVKKGEFVFTRSQSSASWIKAKVTETTSVEDVGYLIINGKLKVTLDHIIMVNNSWKTAGGAQIGDKLIDTEGRKVVITSIEYMKAKVKVYNLGIENYHTFFADNIWVHNQKGDGGRVTFKDTAYWNPYVQTNDNGEAQISFKLPDDLTTWTLSAVSSSLDTRVGQATAEIVISKDIIVRPILPNILRNGDEAKISAIVQNFTDNSQKFNVGIKFDSGEVENPNFANVEIKAGESKEFYWKVKPNKSNEKAKFVFSAKVIGNEKLVDNLTQEIPVNDFGFFDKNVQVGEGNKDYSIKLSKYTKNNKSDISIQLSSSLLTTLPVAMKYLIEYPYGCVEQTTSRFVPAIIAKKNPEFYQDALKGKNIDEIIEKGIASLESQQAVDGGWLWWGSGDSSPFVSVYVVEYLLEAQKLGYDVDNRTLDNSKRFFNNLDKRYSKSGEAIKLTESDKALAGYGLVLLGENKINPSSDGLSPDVLSLAVMANYLKGNKNPKTNGLSRLESLAKNQGGSVFWESGSSDNFGSEVASTAMAVRAIILAEGNSGLAAKGIKFIMASRRQEYFANTFATAQVIAAATQYSSKEEAETNYSYTVLLDGKNISQGKVSSNKQVIPEINIPVSQIKDNGSKLSVKKNGSGQIYSTLSVNAFNTNKSEKALDKGIKIVREYHNADGQTNLKTGDTALISLKISGLKAGEDYGVIEDQLPAGMVPVNESLNNEYSYENIPDYYSYDWADKVYTQNGVIMSLNRVGPGIYTYTYKARVVNEGKFIVPPATVSLMYSPEIFGRSDAEVVNIPMRVSVFSLGAETVENLDSGKQVVIKGVSLVGGLLIIILTSLYLLRNKGRNYYRLKDKLKNKFKKENKVSPPENS